MSKFTIKRGVTTELSLKAFAWSGFISPAYREIVGHDTVTYIGSFNLTTLDVAFVIGAFAFFRCLTTKEKTLSLVAVFAVLLFSAYWLSFFRGFLASPVLALVGLRTNAVFVIAVLIAATIRSENFPAYLQKALLFCGWVLSAAVLMRLVLGPDFLRSVAAESEGRPLTAQGAILIAGCVAVFASRSVRNASAKSGLLALFFLAVLIATRQGTATAAGVAGLGVVLVFEWGRNRQVRILAGVFALICLAAVAVVDAAYLNPANLLQTLFPGSSEFVGNRLGTLETRLLIWSAVSLVHDNLPFLDRLIGVPLGQPVRITFDAPGWGITEWEHSYHSMYYAALIKTGIIGAYSYLCLVGTSIVFLVFRSVSTGEKWHPSYATPALAIGLCTITAILSYSYDLRNESGTLIAIGLCSVQALRFSVRDTGVKGETSSIEMVPALRTPS